MYVCDRQGDRLQVFTKDGKFVKEKLILPKTMNAGSVWDMALSSDPQRTVRRRRRERAHSHPAARYARDPDGVRRGGRQPGQWHGVHNIATDSQGNIYTTETYDGKRIQKFTYKGLGPVTKQYQGTPWRRPRGRTLTLLTCMPRAIVRGVRALLLALFACALLTVVSTVADAQPAIRYALAAWSNEQSGDVLAIAQDLDGYLWLGTPDGLVRFDGTRFQPWARAAAARCPRVRLPRSPVPLRWRVGRLCRRRRRGPDRSRWHHVIRPPTVHRPASTRSSRIVAARCGRRPVAGCSVTPAPAGRP